LIGGWRADRVGRKAGWSGKLIVCLCSGLLILPISFLINAAHFNVVLLSVPLYFALSGIVTACGFSAILDAVPNRSRGLAMSVSFLLNMALGAGVGPTAVAFASAHVFRFCGRLGAGHHTDRGGRIRHRDRRIAGRVVDVSYRKGRGTLNWLPLNRRSRNGFILAAAPA